MTSDWIRINGLAAFGIVGLHAWERERTQEILIDASIRVDLGAMGESDRVADGLNYGDVAGDLLIHAETAQRHTIEALATDLAGICLDGDGVEEVVIHVSKPRADPRAKRIGVEVSRRAGDLVRRACISLGSNSNARQSLPESIRRLASVGRLIGVSSVYESAPVGQGGGPNYLNAAVLMETPLPAGAIMRKLKTIEASMGRRRDGVENDVPIDLDLCLLGDQTVRTGGVDVPDPELSQRAYLAQSISELDEELRHPETSEPIREIAARLAQTSVARRLDDLTLSIDQA